MISSIRKRTFLIIATTSAIIVLSLFSMYQIGNKQSVTALPSTEVWSSPEEFSQLWRKATVAERRSYFDGLFGIKDVLSKILSDSEYSYNPDLQNSLLNGMSKEEVVNFLGTPDSNTDQRLAYEISVIKELEGIDKAAVWLGLHPGHDPSYMKLYFDENGILNHVSIPR